MIFNLNRLFSVIVERIILNPQFSSENLTVKDAALKIHKTFYELFDHAIVIRESDRQKRKKVGLDYVLIDNDIIEFSTI